MKGLKTEILQLCQVKISFKQNVSVVWPIGGLVSAADLESLLPVELHFYSDFLIVSTF